MSSSRYYAALTSDYEINPFFSTVPSEPHSFVLSSIPGSPQGLFVSWLVPEIQNGIIISYIVYCEEVLELDMMASGIRMESGDSASESDMFAQDNRTVLVVVVPGNETEVTFPDLVPYTVYRCYASASTSAGEGNFTVQLTARTDESGKEKNFLCSVCSSKFNISQFVIDKYMHVATLCNNN